MELKSWDSCGGTVRRPWCPVGLDGIQLFAGNGSALAAHKYPIDAISRWHLADKTILTVHVNPTPAGADTAIAVSSDEAWGGGGGLRQPTTCSSTQLAAALALYHLLPPVYL